MDLNEIKRSLRKFFRGEETEEGRWLINQWYHYFDEEPNELADYSEDEKEKLRRELWLDIKKTAGLPQKRHQQKGYSYSRNEGVWPARVAAGFIIVLLAALSVLYFQSFTNPQEHVEKKPVYMTAHNPVGQISRIVLADGSTVWLSAASTLRYPKKFGDSLRSVSLKGEAFFDVTKNSDKPFIVNSGGLQTKVLGTSFNIRVFEGEEDIEVTVATGRVAVQQRADSVSQLSNSSDSIAELTPDEQFVFNKNGQTGIKRTVKSTLYTSWKDGKLIFENHSFKDIAQRLERWYGVKIHFTDTALKKIRFKVTFENNSLQHALRMLQVIENFEFKMEDNQVWIKPSSK